MQAVPTLAERIDISVRIAFAYLSMALFFILNIVFMQQMFGHGLEIPLILMTLYYWSTYRQTLLPVWLVFIAGFLYDIFAGFPPGMTALTYIFLQWIVVDQRVFLMGQPYIMFWIGFLFVSLAAGLMQWGLFGLTQLTWAELDSIAFSAFLGALFFPLGSLFFHLVHKILPAQ